MVEIAGNPSRSSVDPSARFRGWIDREKPSRTTNTNKKVRAMALIPVAFDW